MDFGVARLAGGTAATGIVGTPSYMSPEQVQGDTVDGRSDVFSAGLILYELVTGERAYGGDSVVAVVYKIAHEDPDLSLLPRGAEWARLREVLAAALGRNPEQRYPTAGHMQDQLSLALRDLGGTTDGTTASDRGLIARSGPRRAAAVPAPGPEPVESAAAAPPAPRRRATAARLGLSIAAAAVLAVIAVGGRRRAGRSPETPATTLKASAPPSAAAIPRPPSASAAAPLPSDARAIPIASPTPSTRAVPRGGPSPDEEAAPRAGGRLDRANELLEKGRFAAALAEARAVLRRDPASAEAKMIAEEAEAATVVETRLKDARAALAGGDRDGALAAVRSGLAVSPNDARLLALFRELTQ